VALRWVGSSTGPYTHPGRPLINRAYQYDFTDVIRWA
jgi:hypothetical protein